MKLKIVLVQPPIEDFYFTPHRSSVLGLESLASAWRAFGHSCDIINFTAVKPLKKSLALPAELSYLSPYIFSNPEKLSGIPAGTSFFRRRYRFGPDAVTCAGTIMKIKPDVVAVSCFAWAYAGTAFELLEKLNNMRMMPDSNVLLVAGGAGVTVMPERFASCADLVVTGEGESAIGIIEKMTREPGVTKSGLIEKSPMLEKIPFAGRIVRIRKSRAEAAVMLSRGCPGRCSFCANHLVSGRKQRLVPLDDVYAGVERILGEISESELFSGNMKARNIGPVGEQAKAGVVHFNFEDDNILLQADYFLKVLAYTGNRVQESGYRFSFSVENGMDYLRLDRSIIKIFKDMNITQINISMGSLDPVQLKSEKRHGNMKKLEEVLDISREFDIPAVTYFICGLKGDSPDSVVDALRYLHRLETLTGISLYYPVPGLPDWSCKEVFNENPAYLCCGSSAYPWYGSLTTREMVTAFRLARASNYIKGEPRNEGLTEEIFQTLIRDDNIEIDMVKGFFGMLC